MPSSRIPPLRFCLGHCKAMVSHPGFNEPVRRRRFNGPHLRNKVGICGEPMTPLNFSPLRENPTSSETEDDGPAIIRVGQQETGAESDSTTTKKRNRRNRKEQERIRAQAQAFQRLVIKGSRRRRRGNTAASVSAAEGQLLSRPGSTTLHTSLKRKKRLRRRRKGKISSKGIIRIPFFNGGRSGSAAAAASKEMQEMFIQKGIFVPKGYTLTKNCLIPIKKKKTICLDGCRYDVVRRIANQVGFKEVAENDVWNIIWTDVPISLDKALEMRRFQDAHSIFWGTAPPLQRANHFPGMNEICRKDRLARNLNRMKKNFPTEYNFFPRTWSLPADISDLIMYSRKRRHLTYICKPDSGCQGRGIFLMRNMKKLNPFAKLICQVYIPRPFLIDGYKFDLRIYILITSCDPLHIYIYDEGIARFATVKYELPSDNNVDVIFMHLTNYSLNKFSQSYAPEPDGSKRKVSSVYNWMESQGLDLRKLKNDIDSVIVKTMIAAQPTLRHYYRSSFPKQDRGCACFEILGFDILLDHKLKPYLLEVNHSPSFNLDLPVDAEIKEALLRDTFNKLYLGRPSDVRAYPETKQRRHAATPSNSLTITDCAGHGISSALETQFLFESHQPGNFRLIYPAPETALRYAHFFQQTPALTCADPTIASNKPRCRFKSPSINNNPTTVTKKLNRNTLSTSTTKKNKINSYIAVAYDNSGEAQDDEGAVPLKDPAGPVSALGLGRVSEITNDPRLIDVLRRRDGVEQQARISSFCKVSSVIEPSKLATTSSGGTCCNQMVKVNQEPHQGRQKQRRAPREKNKIEIFAKAKKSTCSPPTDIYSAFKYPTAVGQDLASCLSPWFSAGDKLNDSSLPSKPVVSIQTLFQQAKERARKRMPAVMEDQEQLTKEQRIKMEIWNEKSNRIRNWITSGGYMEPQQEMSTYPAPDVVSTMVAAVRPGGPTQPTTTGISSTHPLHVKGKENLLNSKFDKEKDMRQLQSDALGGDTVGDSSPVVPRHNLYTSLFKDYALAPCLNFMAPEPPPPPHRVLFGPSLPLNSRTINSSTLFQERPSRLTRFRR